MITCPNKNLQEWKDLVNVFSEEGALALYATNSENIPTIKDAFDLLYKGKVNITDPLRAWDTGSFSGKDQKQYEPQINELILKDPTAKVGGGESFNDVRDRAIAEGKRILDTAPANSLAVSHSTALKFIFLWDKAGRPADTSKITAKDYLDVSTTPGEMEKLKGTNGTVFFVRHGETEDNADGMLRTDSTLLTEKGVQQAIKVGEQLKTIGISEVYTSPLPRALHSTDLIMSKQTLKVLDPNKLFEKGRVTTTSNKTTGITPVSESQVTPLYEATTGLTSVTKATVPTTSRFDEARDTAGGQKYSDIKLNDWNKEDFSDIKDFGERYAALSKRLDELKSMGARIKGLTDKKFEWFMETPPPTGLTQGTLFPTSEGKSFQRKGTGEPRIPGLEKKVKGFLSKLGVQPKNIDRVLDSFGNDVVALVDTANGIIEVSNNLASAESLGHEATHMMIDLLPDNSPLLAEIIKDVKNRPEYQDTIDSYKNDPEYQNEDGSINEEKMAKEAATSIIDDIIVKKYKDKKAMSWWQKLLNWVTNLFKGKKTIDPYEQVAEDILAEDISGLDKDKITKMKEANEKGEIYYEHDKTDLDRINDIRNRPTTTIVQKTIIDAFVLKPEKFEPEIEKTMNELGLKPNELVIFYKDAHEYKNTKGVPYSGLTNKITGKFNKEKQEQYEKNKDVGKDIDAIMEAVILGKTTEEIINTVNTPTLPNDIKYRIIAKHQEFIDQVTSNGEIALTQVIISDPNTMIASAIDLLTVSKTGMFKIYDLKTSVNKVYSYDPVTGKKILSSTYTSLWKQNEGSVFNDLTFDKDDKIVPRTNVDQTPILLSKRLQNGIQVGCYGKMAELQGAPVVGLYSKHNYVTIEAKKDVNGFVVYKKDKEGKNELDSKGDPKVQYIVTKMEDEGMVYHPVEKNIPYIDQIITTVLDENNPSKLQRERTGYYYPNEDVNVDMRSAEEIAADKEKYKEEFNDALDNSELAANIAEKIHQTIAQRIDYIKQLNRSKQTPIIKTDTIIQLTELKRSLMRSLNAGKYSSVINEWMDYTIRQSNTTRDYLNDPENITSEYYPSVIVQAEKFVEGYAYINEMVDQIHSTQIPKFNQAVAAVNDLRKACEQAFRNWGEFDTKQQGTKYMEKEISDAFQGETEDISIGYRLVGAPSATPSVLVSMAFKKISDAEYKARAWWNLFTDELNVIQANFFKALNVSKFSKGMYDFMTYPETGKFVLREGSQHLDAVKAAAEKLQDENGQRKSYLLGKSAEVIAYNKQLHEDIKEYSRLTRAEYYDKQSESYIPGEYYEYYPVPVYDENGDQIGEDNFEEQRKIFEKKDRKGRWVEDFNPELLKDIKWFRDKTDNKYYIQNPDGSKGNLLTEEQVKAIKGLQYRYKFKMSIDKVADMTGQYDANGNFTGVINFFSDDPIWIVKPEYKRLRDKQLIFNSARNRYEDGVDLRDSKYVSMLENNSEVGRARLRFYNEYMDALNRVIIKLPEEQRAYLKGTMPMQSSQLFTQIMNGDLPITKMELLKKTVAKKFSTGTYHGERLVDENGNIKHSIPTGYSGSKFDQDAIDKVNEKINDLNAKWNLVKDTATKEERFNYNKQHKLLVDERATLERKIKPYQIEQNIVKSLHDLSYKVSVFDQKSKIEDAFLAIKNVAKVKSQKSQLLKTDADGRPLFRKVLGGITDAMKRLTYPGSNEYKRIVDMENMLLYQSNEYGNSFWAKLEQLPIMLTSLNLFLINPPVSFGVSISMKATHLREAIAGVFFNLKQLARSEYIMNKEMIPAYISNQAVKASGGDAKKYASYGEAWIGATQANTKLMIEDFGIVKQIFLLEHFVEYSGIAIGAMSIGMNTPVKGLDGEISNAYDCWIMQPDGNLKIDPNYEESYNKIAISLNRKMADYQNRFHGAYAQLEAAALTQYPGGRSVMFLHKYVWAALTNALGPRMVHSNLGIQEGKYITLYNFVKDLKQFEGSIWKKMETGFREMLPLGATDNPDTWDEMTQDEKEKATEEAYRKREQFHKKDKNGNTIKDENDQPVMDEEKIQRDKDTRNMEYANMKRNLIDVVYLMVLYASYLMLKSLAEDSDPGAAKKWANFLAKTFDRLRKQSLFAMPVLGLEEQYTFLKSPIASLRTMGDFAEAFSATMGMVVPPYDKNYYSNGVHKGELKAKVKWQKTLPGINLVPWFKEQNNPNFWVK